MKILITGGAGFLGQKIARALAGRGELRGRAIEAMTLADAVSPTPVVADFPVLAAVADIGERDQVEALFADPPDVVFHLAAIVSAGAEADLDLGLRVNLHGTIHVFEAARASGAAPVLVYASSAAVHGGEEPEVVTDGVELNPQTSYGTQKAIGELLLNDFSRRGLIDGRGLRIPTVSIRPGKPNAAASSFMSSIFREPLQGETANCPVGRDYPIWHSAPRTVVANFIHAAEIDAAGFGPNRCLNLPGRTDTVGEMIDAMSEVAGAEPATRITWDKDAEIERIVMGWRGRFEPQKARRLGFAFDRSFADNVRWFLDDDIESGRA